MADDHARITFLDTLEQLRQRYNFYIFGYVLMPEHLLLSYPSSGNSKTMTWPKATDSRWLPVPL